MIVLKAAQEKLLGALQAVAGIVERRHTLPILANVLLRKNAGDIEFTTSDLEIQVRTKADLGGDAGVFSTTLGARKLIDILRTLPADQVVTLSTGTQVVTTGFSVTPGHYISSITPNSGTLGQTLTVAVQGVLTHFVAGQTTLTYGPDITVSGVTVTSPTTLTAQVAIAVS